MRELVSIAFAAILPILYIGTSKNFFFARFRKYTGVIAVGAAIFGAILLMIGSEQRLAYASFAPLGHFAVIVVVEESFKRTYGRYAAAVYSHPYPPKDRLVDKGAMLVAVLACLAITAATLYLGRKAVGL